MIFADAALILNWLAIFATAFIVTLGFASVVFVLLAAKLLNFTILSRKAILWAIVTVPWINSIVVASYFFAVEGSTAEGLQEYAHWHHLEIFYLYSWHGAALALFGALFFTVLIKAVYQTNKFKQQLSMLTAFSTLRSDCSSEIDTALPIAFATGFINKRCYVSNALINILSDEQLNIVLEHEKAHLKANDPLFKWLFSLLSAFYLKAVGGLLRTHLTLVMEQAADQQTVDQGFSNTLIAATLVKVARANAKQPELVANTMLTSFGADVLEQRVLFLLGKLKLKPVKLSYIVAIIGMCIGLCILGMDSMHHRFEVIFDH